MLRSKLGSNDDEVAFGNRNSGRVRMLLVFGFWPGDAYSRDGIIFRDVVRAWPDEDQAERYGANGGAIL